MKIHGVSIRCFDRSRLRVALGVFVWRLCRLAFSRRRIGLEKVHLDRDHLNLQVHRFFQLSRQVLLKHVDTLLKIFCGGPRRNGIEINVELTAPIGDDDGLDFRVGGENVGAFRQRKRGVRPRRRYAPG